MLSRLTGAGNCCRKGGAGLAHHDQGGAGPHPLSVIPAVRHISAAPGVNAMWLSHQSSSWSVSSLLLDKMKIFISVTLSSLLA